MSRFREVSHYLPETEIKPGEPAGFRWRDQIEERNLRKAERNAQRQASKNRRMRRFLEEEIKRSDGTLHPTEPAESERKFMRDQVVAILERLATPRATALWLKLLSDPDLSVPENFRLRHLKPISVYALYETEQIRKENEDEDKKPTAELLINEIGGKAWGLARLAQMGLPVPPGLVIATSFADVYEVWPEYALAILEPVFEPAINKLVEQTRKVLGSSRVSSYAGRSGAAVSIPGGMDTLAYMGISEHNLEALSEQIGVIPALEAYIKLIITYAEKVFRVNLKEFKWCKLVSDILKEYGDFSSGQYELIRQVLLKLPPEVSMGLLSSPSQEKIDLKPKVSGNPLTEKQIAAETRSRLVALMQDTIALLIAELSQRGYELPIALKDQLLCAVIAVVLSGQTPAVKEYRRQAMIRGSTGVTIQAMLFGTTEGERVSGSGVAATYDVTKPNSPKGKIDFARSKSGAEVVDGLTARHATRLPEQLEADLQKMLQQIEQEFFWPQEVEFTVENGKIWLLQTRTHRHEPANLLAFLINRKGLPPAEALRLLTTAELNGLVHRGLDPESVAQATKEMQKAGQSSYLGGLNAWSGVASGVVVCSVEEAKQSDENHQDCILYLNAQTTVEDLPRILPDHVTGILAESQTFASHFTRRLETLGRPAMIQATSSLIEPGKMITIDTFNHQIFDGEIPLAPENTETTVAGVPVELIKHEQAERAVRPWGCLKHNSKLTRKIAEKIRHKISELPEVHSHKAKELAVANAVYSEPLYNRWEIVAVRNNPNDLINRVRTKLAYRLSKFGSAALRSGHHPAWEGGSPYHLFTDINDLDSFFDQNSSDNIHKWLEHPNLTELLIGSPPREEIDPQFTKDHCVWTLSITDDGLVTFEVLMGTMRVRDFEREENVKRVISLTFDPILWQRQPAANPVGLIKVKRGEVPPTIAELTKFELIANKILYELWNTGGITNSFAAVSQVFPKGFYGSPVFEGIAQFNKEGELLRTAFYGIKVDRKFNDAQDQMIAV